MQLDDLATIMAQVMKSGGASPPVPAAATTAITTTAPVTPTNTVTTTTPAAGAPHSDDRTVNINLVMPEGAERDGNNVYALGRGRGFR